MKNQYFGDINDYRKYGLLRSIIEVSKLRVLVAWMLTLDDDGNDGKKISFLDQPEKWSKYDPQLFQEIRDILASKQPRQVSMIENTGLLLKAEYFSVCVPDSASDRDAWHATLVSRSQRCELVFLDPDNGIEVKSKPRGRKNSSKYVYWPEIEKLWSSGKSLLIYQHFPMEKRVTFIQRMLEALGDATPGSLVEAFSTPHVVFLMALQPSHHRYHAGIVNLVQERWEGQIHHWELFRAQQST